MPTLNPRTNVTLSPSLDLLVVRLAAFSGSSKSQVLRELLEAAEPALQRAVALMEAASKATQNVKDGLAKSLSDAQDVAEAQLAGHIEYLDQAAGDLVRQAEGVRGRRASSASMRSVPPSMPAGGALNPRPVTRGLGIPPGAVGRSKKGARHG